MLRKDFSPCAFLMMIRNGKPMSGKEEYALFARSISNMNRCRGSYNSLVKGGKNSSGELQDAMCRLQSQKVGCMIIEGGSIRATFFILGTSAFGRPGCRVPLRSTWSQQAVSTLRASIPCAGFGAGGSARRRPCLALQAVGRTGPGQRFLSAPSSP